MGNVLRGCGLRSSGVGALAVVVVLGSSGSAFGAGWTAAQVAPPPPSSAGSFESFVVGVDGAGVALMAWNGGRAAAPARSLRPGGRVRVLPPLAGFPERLVVTPGGQWYASGYGGAAPTRPWTARLVGRRWVTTVRGDDARTAVAALATRGEELLVGVLDDRYANQTTLSTFRQPWRQRSFPLGSGPLIRGGASSAPVFLSDGSAVVVEPTTANEVPTMSRLRVVGRVPGSSDVPGVLAEPELATEGARVAMTGIEASAWGDVGPIGKVRVSVGSATGLTAPQLVPGSVRAMHPRVVVLPGGPAIVTWVEKVRPAAFREYGVPRWASVDMASGAVTASGALSRSRFGYAPQVAVVDGRAAVVWGEGLPSDPRGSVWRAASIDGSGVVTSLGRLPGRSVGRAEYVPSVQVSGNGAVLAAAYSDGADAQLRLAVRRVR